MRHVVDMHVRTCIDCVCVCSLNADILKSTPEFLLVVSKHLFGQLQCFVAVKNRKTMKVRGRLTH